MKKILVKLLFTIFGAVLSATIIIIFFFGSILGLASIGGSANSVVVENNTVLNLDLEGYQIVEQGFDNPFAELFRGNPYFDNSQLGLNDILSCIHKAAVDDNITGIYLSSGYVTAGLATLTEIRDALDAFKESGKFVYAYSNSYSQKGYYLASVANKVYVTPQGGVSISGLSTQGMYYKDALDKLGIEMQVFKVGKYKSAVEPYIHNEMSDAAREQSEVYLNSIWDFMKTKMGDSRSITTSSIDDYSDSGKWFNDNRTLYSNGFIDGLLYYDGFLDSLRTASGVGLAAEIPSVTVADYKNVSVSNYDTNSLSSNKIAIIYAEGGIDSGGSAFGDDLGIDSQKLSQQIREARIDESIKAVVLRVNSPGGSGLGSDIIWREMDLCKQTKPTIVSMGDYAASGGYYISCPADYIIASPATLTGSIGVFGLMPNAQKLANDKLGLYSDGVQTNKYSSLANPSIIDGLSNSSKALIQSSVQSFYSTFLQRCALGRHSSVSEIHKIAEGRVWSGSNALDINLVDKLGGINDAIALASTMAEVSDDYTVIELPEQELGFNQLFETSMSRVKGFVAKEVLGFDVSKMSIPGDMPKEGEKFDMIQARMPYEIKIE